jgi:hypothetical protein
MEQRRLVVKRILFVCLCVRSLGVGERGSFRLCLQVSGSSRWCSQ